MAEDRFDYHARSRALSHGWTVREITTERSSPTSTLPALPAKVPGHVHLDLMAAGVIQDPFYRLGERGSVWVDHTDWAYETTFDVEARPALPTYLSFDGLDTLAEIELNGAPIGSTDNMFVAHEFEVTDRLRSGANTLRIVFRSPIRTGWERQKAWDEAGNDTMPFDWNVWNARSFIRKAQYMYGWDWGPEPVSCGIWGPVSLVTVPVARFLDWRYDVEFTPEGPAMVHVEAFVERMPEHRETPLALSVDLSERVCLDRDPEPSGVSSVEVDVPAGIGRIAVRATLKVDDPERWRPAGQGGSNEPFPILYQADLTLTSGEGVAFIDHREAKIGLRSVELIREPDLDGPGESFKFRVNGEDLFAKGANWIPVGSFPSEFPTGTESEGTEDGEGTEDDEPDSIETLLFAAHRAGMNMMRIWGGGLYESDRFYELCDALGLLVWQDFPYACAYYPDTGDYADAGKREAIAAARRLRIHPSLALWCGNNENDQMYHDGWSGHRPPRLLGEKLYHEILPAVVEAEDPGRPYWPSSPYGGGSPNDPNVGDRHDWDVWHGVGDWTHYPEDDSRFVSEFGFASSCGMAAWDGCLVEADKEPRSAAVRWHDKTRKGYETYLGYIALHYPEPVTLEDLVYYSQINQAEALKCGIEHWRRRKGRCWGTLFWQLNDCWPVQSWSVIDWLGEPKAAFYAATRFYAPVLLSLVHKDGSVRVHLTSDRLQPIAGTVTVALETFEGERLAEISQPATVGKNGTTVAASLDLAASTGRERDVFVHAEFTPDSPDLEDAVENYLFLAEPKDLRLPDPALSVEVEPEDGESVCFTVTAARFAPYVWLRLEEEAGAAGQVEWSDNFFHLRAGQPKELILYPATPAIDAAEVRARLRIRTL